MTIIEITKFGIFKFILFVSSEKKRIICINKIYKEEKTQPTFQAGIVVGANGNVVALD